MKSIIQSEKKCFMTGRDYGLDKHHIYFGSGQRKVSEENGFWVYLGHEYHIADSTFPTPHNDVGVDLAYKKLCQIEFEKIHTREEFMKLIGRNYLDW